MRGATAIHASNPDVLLPAQVLRIGISYPLRHELVYNVKHITLHHRVFGNNGRQQRRAHRLCRLADSNAAAMFLMSGHQIGLLNTGRIPTSVLNDSQAQS